MRVPLALVVCLAASAQQSKQSTTYTYDVNGRRIASAEASSASANGGSTRTERIQSINGKTVPLETVEETVLSDGPSGRVVERLVRRFDATGRPGAPEKVRVEERKNADGSSTVETTTWQGDLNARFQLHEKTRTHTAKTGDVQRSETAVERPTVGGSLELIERRLAVETGKPEYLDTEATTWRKSQNGGFYEAARELIQKRVDGAQTAETATRYNAANSGKLEFAGRTVSRLEKRADGSETQVVDVYGAVLQGRTIEGYGGGARLREQQVIERAPGAEGSVIETFSVRRPSLDGSAQLGALQKISETRCTGDCAPKPKP